MSSTGNGLARFLHKGCAPARVVRGDLTFSVFSDREGRYRWRCRAHNGLEVAVGAGGKHGSYSTPTHAWSALVRFVNTLAAGQVTESGEGGDVLQRRLEVRRTSGRV